LDIWTVYKETDFEISDPNSIYGLVNKLFMDRKEIYKIQISETSLRRTVYITTRDSTNNGYIYRRE